MPVDTQKSTTFADLLQTARACKEAGMTQTDRFVYLHGYRSGCFFGHLRGLDKGVALVRKVCEQCQEKAKSQ